jgi:hypothetical protein
MAALAAEVTDPEERFFRGVFWLAIAGTKNHRRALQFLISLSRFLLALIKIPAQRGSSAGNSSSYFPAIHCAKWAGI